ncbi:MAG: hypothetical protein AABW56_00860 [Nanoarchaeota archaeon]
MKKQKVRLLKGNRLKPRALPIEPTRAVDFIRELYHILNERADKIKEEYNTKPSTSFYWVENNEKVYVEDIITQPKLSLEMLHGRSIGLETDLVYHNHNKQYNMLKRSLDSPLIIHVSKNGEDVLYYTFPVNDLALNLHLGEKTERAYRRRN